MAHAHKPINIIHRGRLKHVEFTFAVGDLFDAKVDAIVSSEQTDFILSRNPESLSGQIWNRYGDRVQHELDVATNGQVLRAGTVLDTSGGQDFVRIFHAGFHDPDDWLTTPVEPGDSDNLSDASGGSRGADYFAAIGSCIAQVLDAAVAQKLIERCLSIDWLRSFRPRRENARFAVSGCYRGARRQACRG